MDKKDLEQIKQIVNESDENLAQIIAKGFAGTATKEDLKGLATQDTLGKVTATLERTTALVANLSEDMKDLKSDVKVIRASVESHTISLDEILKNTKHWQTEATALRSAIKRHEDWFMQIAAKIGIKLEGLEDRSPKQVN